MGQKISTSFIQSTHKVNDIDLKFQINGAIQQNVTDKNLQVKIKGGLYIDQGKITNVSEVTKQEFIDFVQTERFEAYITDVLFLKNSEFPLSFPYSVPKNTISNLSWNLISTPEATFDENVFTVCLQFKIDDPTNQTNTLRSSVVYMSKSLIDALKERRVEDMPITDENGNSLKFGPDEIAFSLMK